MGNYLFHRKIRLKLKWVMNHFEISPHFSLYFDQSSNFQRKMKLFCELKGQFKMLGIEENQQKKFNRKNILALSLLAYTFVGMIIFVLFEKSTFTDYSKALIGALSMLLNFLTCSSNLLNQTIIFDLINKIECVIDKSK